MVNLSIILASLSSLTIEYSTIDYEAINQEIIRGVYYEN